MAGTPPNGKSWVSSSWRDYVLQLADDIQRMQQYMPLLEFSARDTAAGGGGSDSRTFLSRIIGAGGHDEGFDPNGCNYRCVEVVGPRGSQSLIEISQDPDITKPSAAEFLASNTYEEGLVCGGEASNMVIPPAYASTVATGGGCFFGLTCSPDHINEGSIVTMHAKVCPEDDNFPCSDCLSVDRLLGENVFYWFSAVIQPCLGCEEDEPGGGGGGVPTPPPNDSSVFDLPVTDNNRNNTFYK